MNTNNLHRGTSKLHLQATISSISKRSHHNHNHNHNHNKITKKRRFDYGEETLTLKRCSVDYQSNSKRFSSSQSSYHQKRRRRRNYKHRVDSRKWTYSEHDCSGFTDKLVVASYNILGVENASRHPDLYLNIPHKYLAWDYRKALICEELTQYDPSILCFQEVDRFSDLHDSLQQHGFKGVFKARIGDACDGCAIFWKDDRFTILYEEDIEFQSFGLRNNIAQFCILKMNGDRVDSEMNNMSMSEIITSRSLVVGNIHVLFNPNRGDIKLGQIRLFLEKAHRLSLQWGRIPIVLAGDFNSMPQSAIYQFISSAKLDILQHDRRKISGQIDVSLHSGSPPFAPRELFRQRLSQYRWNDEELKLATGNEQMICLQHHLKLCSAYLSVPGNDRTRDNNGEPLATSCHSKFKGTVDYIWHSESLLPIRILETLPMNVLQNMGGLPNEKWGSDHLALVCEFAFKK